MKSLIPCCVVVFLFHSVLQAERIVDFGHDWGVGFYRDIWAKPQGEADIDGDGDTSDDHPKGWDFRMDIPLNPTESTYDDQLPTATFYGGVYVGVTDPAGSKRGWPSEGHINQNHEMRDDWNLMALPSISKQPELESYEAAGIWLWKKADFLNGGSRGTVRFAAGDFIAVYVSRYWGGIHWGRWMLQDGDTFYVSEPTFGNSSKAIDLSVDDGLSAGRNPIVRTGHLLQPSEVKWAVHTPNRNAIRSLLFDVESAEFKPRNFNDVQAVGFMVQRNLSVGSSVDKALSLNEPIALKFNAVHVEATVDRPSFLASPHVDLVGVGGTEGQPTLWAGKTEVTYEQWLQIFRWADSNQRVRNHSDGIDRHIPPYAFVRDGAIGSAEASLAPEHLPQEPVTTITWLDAVLWCNALSELEGLEPAYYADAEFTTPLRVGIDRRNWETRDDRPVVHWKTGAAGYRLPTPGEWRALAAGASPDPAEAWTASNAQNKTRPVGKRNPAPSGLHDLFGNVAEWVWTPSGPVMDPAVVDRVGAFGGSYLRAEGENEFSPIPFGHVPWNGDPAIGFRVVRNGAGRLSDPGQEVPYRVVTRKQVIPPRQPPTGEQLRAWVETRLGTVQIGDAGQLDAGATEKSLKKTSDRYPLLAFTTEMPYEVWIRVKQWSEIEKGYRYNFSGDMGSARRNISLPRSPREPVTQVSWFDAVVWCNALSELYGLEPVYLNEEGQVEREASPFRLTTYGEYQYPNEGRYTQRPVDTAMVFDYLPDPKRNGYRLPTVEEMRAIGMTERYGPLNKAGTVDTGWFLENSGGKAHPVGTKTANAQGIHDALGNVQEWTYGGSGLFGQNRYGNDFGFASDNYPHTMNRQDHVSSARAYLGFRPVRRAEFVLP